MDETLNLIAEALAGVDENVYYGTAIGHPKAAPWDYTVFSRSSTKFSGGLTGHSDTFIVAVVRENYVPEDMFGKVRDAMCGIPGMKPSQADTEYVYDVRPNTSRTVEMMVMRFVRAVKR